MTGHALGWSDVPPASAVGPIAGVDAGDCFLSHLEPFHPLPWQAADSLFVQGSQSSLAAAEEIDWKFKVCFSRQSCLEEDV